MAKKFLVDIDLQQNELQNAVVANLTTATAPATPVAGQVYYDTTTSRITMFDGGVSAFKKLLTEDDQGSASLAGLTDTTVAGLADGDILTYDNATSKFVNKPVTGDVTITSGGVTSITAGSVVFADINTGAYSADLSTSATTTELARADAVKAYVDSAVATADAYVLKGSIDTSTNPNYPAADAGDTYVVSVAGLIGGAAGIAVEVGDIILSTIDANPTGDQATVGANWTIIQGNTDATGVYTALGITAGATDLGTFTGTTVTDNVSVVTAVQELETAVETKTSKYIQTFGDGTALTYTINHALNDVDVIAQVRDASSLDVIECDIVMTDANNVTVTFASAPATNDMKIVVIG